MIVFMPVSTSFWSTWRDTAKLRTGNTEAVANQPHLTSSSLNSAAGVGMNGLDVGLA